MANLFSKVLLGASLVVAGTQLTGCESAPTEGTLDITPIPSEVTWKSGTYRINSSTKLYIDAPEADRKMLSEYMLASPLKLQLSEQKTATEGIVLRQVEALQGVTSPEGYMLRVNSDGVQIEALSGAGLFYGLQSLLQMADDGDAIQGVEIKDEPRFQYRGMMLDVSRHFFTKEFVKKQIDVLAYYKINRLHLHLTDGAGWRIEIKKYPRLTQFAAWRTDQVWKPWWNGGRKYVEEGDPNAHGGYYTQDDIREIVAYAQKHYITVIPEIEMPAHSEEALAAYPELSCAGKPYKQSDYCVGNEKTFEFLENVLLEVMDLFPSKDIHVGGDEAGKAAWKTCPKCQARMKKEGLKDVDELQSYLIHRIERFLNEHGRNLLGWDEILQGGLAPNATVMSWRGTEGGLKAIHSGHRAIMSPGTYCYLDSYQDAPHTQPEAIGGYLTLEKVYSYNPIPDSLTVEERKLMYGVQANLWTEYVPTPEHAEYMLYPRMIALAEIGWSKQENRSWQNFQPRALAIVEELKQKGYHPFDLKNQVGDREESKTPVQHLALNKKVDFKAPSWKQYPANGDATLTDGNRGNWNYSDLRWMAFITKKGVDAVIDLEQEMDLKSIKADFMQICGPGVYMPGKVIISVSSDGKKFTKLTEIDNKVVKDDGLSFKNFGWEGQTKGRYVHYQAIPSEEFGGVLFVDEIIVK